jgi:hypothetical protein
VTQRVAAAAAALLVLLFGIGGDYANPDPLHLAALVAGAAGLGGALAGRAWAGWLTLTTLVVLGALARATADDFPGSDVLPATREAVAILAAGADPYAHVYASTVPPGGVFAYPPGEIVFYAIAQRCGADILRVEHATGILTLLAVAALAPLCGSGFAALAVGVLALAGDLVERTGDGSNDTSASLLILVALLCLAWSLATRGRHAQALWFASAVGFGWAVAFKQYTLPMALFAGLFVWRTSGGRRASAWIAVAAGTTALFVVPFFVWNPAGFIANVGGAYLAHPAAYGRNVWRDLVSFVPGLAAAASPFVPFLALLALAAVTVALWRRPTRSLGAAFLHGCVAVATALVVARWTSSVYWVFLAAPVAAGTALTLGAAPPLGEGEGLGAE